MRPFTLLIKPAGPDCNIACEYCFYACKEDYFGGGAHRMSDEVLETLVRDYMSLKFQASIFAWQGGEPTLMGLDFFKRVVELQQQYGTAGQVVSNSLQTNGILLDDKWCEFLSEYRILVGISLDGPKKYHDFYRTDRAGNGTYDKVIAAIECCRTHGVQFNVLVLLNKNNVEHPDELFDFFVSKKIRFLQFVQCVERDPKTGQIADFSITGDKYGDFLCRIYDRWRDFGPEKLSIRTFDSLLSYCLTGRHTECTLGQRCDDYVVVEHNGDVFCCDFFVEDEAKLGNILETPIGELAGSKKKRDFGRAKRKLAHKCLICRHLDICRGGCPKDRLAGYGKYDAASWFCDGYRKLFDHALGGFWELAAKLRSSGTQD